MTLLIWFLRLPTGHYLSDFYLEFNLENGTDELEKKYRSLLERQFLVWAGAQTSARLFS